jgi:hypothetical protein
MTDYHKRSPCACGCGRERRAFSKYFSDECARKISAKSKRNYNLRMKAGKVKIKVRAPHVVRVRWPDAYLEDKMSMAEYHREKELYPHEWRGARVWIDGKEVTG